MNETESLLSPPVSQRLEASVYEPMMSAYLRERRRQEQWYLNWVEWDGSVLRASARLDGAAPSPTDQGRMHLSIYAAREMNAQLAIITMHLRLGVPAKTVEVWLLRCVEECTAAITLLEDVRYEMTVKLRRTSSGKVLTRLESKVGDSAGGLIRIQADSLMPRPPEALDFTDEW